MRTRWCEFVFLTGFLALSVPAFATSNWEGNVVYQIFPRSYRDSNGDGIGDFRGIQAGLPTIRKLGCTAIMINPVAKSRVYHNYFADDMMKPDPAFGTLSEFRAMVRAAHRAGIKVVLDMEPQYVADHQLWFASWIKNHSTPYANYLWIAGSPAWGSGKNWYDGEAVRIATVNPANPKVLAYVEKVFRFWANQGTDGFRIDHMMDDLDSKHVKVGLLKSFWKPIELAVRRDHPNAFFIAEQADWESNTSVRDIFHQTPTDAAFAFPLCGALLSLKKDLIESAMRTMWSLIPPGHTEFTFLENHDMKRFASAQPDPRKRRLDAALLLLLKGTPSIYYGQELGMKGVQGHWGTDGNDIPVRLGYRWSATLRDPRTPHWYAGTGPWAIPIYSKDHDGISLAEEVDSPDSTFNFYRRMIHFRLAHPALRVGDQQIVEVAGEHPNVLAFTRGKGAERFLIYANLGEEAVSLPNPEPKPTKDLLSGNTYGAAIRLAPYAVSVIRLPVTRKPKALSGR